MPTITLPGLDGRLAPFATSEPRGYPDVAQGPFSRIAFSAVHVVADPLSTVDPWVGCAVDWDATIAYRSRLWNLGLGVAEAMDTAQRGMGLDWPTSLELIRRSIDASRDHPGARVFSGCGTDHLDLGERLTVADVIEAYEHQAEAIEGLGGRLIVMASRALAACARSPDQYGLVYDRLLAQVREPVILHWLGDMFDPALAGYWGHDALDEAMDVAVEVINRNAAKIDGVKVSLLDKDREIAMRRRLAPGVRMYTGDDFNFAELIAGDAHGHSDALLGIFDAIAPAASAALTALARDDVAGFHAILGPTVPLSRHIFCAPTRFYKTGVVFMAWLNGLQDHFVMVGGQQSTRHVVHLAELFRLADAAGLLRDPGLACARMRALLATHGIDA
ncbi:MAG: dihydrodipicolinate synthase family protein [Burkholderiales bacterium]|nr:MAG: dihydrodipicolinate synthase family protein [Burkholderiales bacterium]